MKRLLLLGLLFTSATFLRAQVIFNVEQPASIEGNYPLSYVAAGGDWAAIIDIENPANAISRIIEIADDGTAGDSLGCFTLNNNFASEGWVKNVTITNSGTLYNQNLTGVATSTTGSGTGLTVDITVDAVEDTILTVVVNDWGTGYAVNDVVTILAGNNDAEVTVAQLAGKIAVIYRGSCEFGLKALNAQNAGADGVIIVNNDASGAVGMGAGASGGTVQIPVISIGSDIGEIIRSEYDNQDVQVFIGNKNGLYEYDLAIFNTHIKRPNKFGMFNLLTQDASDYSYTPEGWIFNNGSEDQTGVTLNVTIEVGGDEVYNESATAADIDAGDSALFVLPTFSMTQYPIGYYSVKFSTVSSETDGFPLDNELTADFAVTEDLFSLTRLTENDLSLTSPNSFFLVPDPNDPVTRIESCVHFRDPNASRAAAYAMSFSGHTRGNAEMPLDGIIMEMLVYTWDDQFTGLNDPNFGIDLLNEIEMQEFFFVGNPQGEVFTVNFDEPIMLQDNRRYLFCVAKYDIDVSIGYDRKYSYEMVFEEEDQPISPFVRNAQFFGLGVNTNIVPAIGVHLIDAELASTDEERIDVRMIAYPIPASDYINVDFQGQDVTGVEMYSIAGQLVLSQSVTIGEDLTKLNVQGVDNGMYIVRVKLANGMTKSMNVVVAR
jgi:hypothetical protein